MANNFTGILDSGLSDRIQLRAFLRKTNPDPTKMPGSATLHYPGARLELHRDNNIVKENRVGQRTTHVLYYLDT